MSLLSKIPSHIGYATCYATVLGGAAGLGSLGIGYLGTRVFNHIKPMGGNPYAALICGAIAGATASLFLHHKTDTVTKIAGLAVLVITPYSICELLQMSLSMHAIALITVISTACAILFQQWLLDEQKNGEEAKKASVGDTATPASTSAATATETEETNVEAATAAPATTVTAPKAPPPLPAPKTASTTTPTAASTTNLTKQPTPPAAPASAPKLPQPKNAAVTASRNGTGGKSLLDEIKERNGKPVALAASAKSKG